VWLTGGFDTTFAPWGVVCDEFCTGAGEDAGRGDEAVLLEKHRQPGGTASAAQSTLVTHQNAIRLPVKKLNIFLGGYEGNESCLENILYKSGKIGKNFILQPVLTHCCTGFNG
jgi:hypothetical protein